MTKRTTQTAKDPRPAITWIGDLGHEDDVVIARGIHGRTLMLSVKGADIEIRCRSRRIAGWLDSAFHEGLLTWGDTLGTFRTMFNILAASMPKNARRIEIWDLLKD